ncbi:MAG TPA: SpoIIE family protein phosphatase [Candidatus Cybelea sp.]|jgi:sigma-B regulation protein RsbU (phosphoserine phosphatase)|nr:SpoIIE family protein phosphatase [Candidatus Cybelea sp.]
MTALSLNLRHAWRRLSRIDLFAMLLILAGAVCALLDFSGGLFSLLKFLAVLATVYVVFRFAGWWRTRLLWSLRNRLIVAYLFIAVVPILLILTLVVLAGQILYSQLGAYLLYDDIHRRIAMMADITDHIAAAHRALPKGASEDESERVLAEQSNQVHGQELPGLSIDFSDDPTLLGMVAGTGKNSFAGLVEEGDKLYLMSLREMPEPKGVRVVTLRLLVTPDFLALIAPDLGAIQLNLTRKFEGGARRGILYTSSGPSGDIQYETTLPILAKNRVLHAPSHWIIDPAVTGFSRLDAVYVGAGAKIRDPQRPVLVTFNARPSRLNMRIFSSLGELTGSFAILFVAILIVFLLIEIAAFITGFVMTRQITKAVSGLYEATQYVKAGDWTHRVRIERRDQLGVLGESFNDMTGSISALLEESKKRQRLENELSIASEVQNQLFPQKVPSLNGVELEAINKAARTVSGDYYDFIQLSPTHLAIALADISGKGISAALLMASLQAALRSQLLSPDSEKMSTADLVARLNMHMVRNTADDRFATFFIAVYDSATRTLRYTNAGHLPGFLISNGKSKHLDKGGMVLGVVEDYVYEEGSVIVPPNALLVEYSDGLVEPENVYGEEFGIRRLQEAAIRVQSSAPRVVGQSLMMAAEEWAGTPEQADDMTVVVARLS